MKVEAEIQFLVKAWLEIMSILSIYFYYDLPINHSAAQVRPTVELKARC